MLNMINPFAWNWDIPDLTGLGGIAFVLGVTIIIYLRYPRLGTILAVAFMARAGGALFHYYIRALPDAGDDALAFETKAWEYAEAGVGVALSAIGTHGLSWMYSHLSSFIYMVIGRHPLFLQSISVLVGVLTVIIAYRMAQDLWGDEKFARKTAWLVALFPTLVLYSSVTMREPFMVFFFALALWYTVKWAQTGLYRYAAIAVVLFFLQVFLHAGMAIAGFILLGVIAFEMTGRFLKRLGQGYVLIVPAFLITIGVIVVSIFWYKWIGISIPYIGKLTELSTGTTIIRQAANVASEASSRWPSWLTPSTLSGVFLVTPFRSFYFLFSPFPWDVRGAIQVIGVLDGFAYMVIFVAIFRNWREIRANRAAMVILLMMIPMIAAFAWGTGNSGTAVRHRSKLVIAFILLAGKYLPRIRYGRP